MHDNEQSRWIATSDLFCVGEIVEYGHQSTHTQAHTHTGTHTHTHHTRALSTLIHIYVHNMHTRSTHMAHTCIPPHTHTTYVQKHATRKGTHLRASKSHVIHTRHVHTDVVHTQGIHILSQSPILNTHTHTRARSQVSYKHDTHTWYLAHHTHTLLYLHYSSNHDYHSVNEYFYFFSTIRKIIAKFHDLVNVLTLAKVHVARG